MYKTGSNNKKKTSMSMTNKKVHEDYIYEIKALVCPFNYWITLVHEQQDNYSEIVFSTNKRRDKATKKYSQ